MTTIAPTPRTTLVRRPNRGVYDRALINAILDEAMICHVGFATDGQPFVLPTIHARIDDRLYLHGAVASRMVRMLATGIPVCVTATLLDGLVLARSAFHHSMNYRSVVVLGVATLVREEAEKRRALDALVEHVVPGRSASVRGPSAQELKATAVVCVPVDEASAKVRTGPPVDDEDDYALSCWAGVIPLRAQALEAEPDPRLAPGIAVPEHVLAYKR